MTDVMITVLSLLCGYCFDGLHGVGVASAILIGIFFLPSVVG